MVQRGGFLNLETLYKAIGMKSEKDEEKAVAAINALHKLYSNFSLDGYEEENKKQMMKMKDKILKDIEQTQVDLKTISADIDALEKMMKETPRKTTDNNVNKTKAYPTPKELNVVTPTPVQGPEAPVQGPEAPVQGPEAQSSSSPTPEPPVKQQLLEPPNPTSAVGGKKRKGKSRKTKKQGRKSKSKKSKSKKSPRTKKHYNQKGGQGRGGCSPIITPAKVNPFQGFAWEGGNVSTWPGVKGIDGSSNFYSPKQYIKQPGMYPDMVSGIYRQ